MYSGSRCSGVSFFTKVVSMEGLVVCIFTGCFVCIGTCRLQCCIHCNIAGMGWDGIIVLVY